MSAELFAVPRERGLLLTCRLSRESRRTERHNTNSEPPQTRQRQLVWCLTVGIRVGRLNWKGRKCRAAGSLVSSSTQRPGSVVTTTATAKSSCVTYHGHEGSPPCDVVFGATPLARGKGPGSASLASEGGVAFGKVQAHQRLRAYPLPGSTSWRLRITCVRLTVSELAQVSMDVSLSKT